MSYVEYDSNNSGGGWWLDDADWKRLEEAGWVVAWERLAFKYSAAGDYERGPDGVPILAPVAEGERNAFSRQGTDGEYRMLGALATKAYKPGCDSLRDAADEWERITGKCATDAGCACCGQPHRFTLYDGAGKYVESGPDTHYEA